MLTPGRRCKRMGILSLFPTLRKVCRQEPRSAKSQRSNRSHFLGSSIEVAVRLRARAQCRLTGRLQVCRARTSAGVKISEIFAKPEFDPDEVCAYTKALYLTPFNFLFILSICSAYASQFLIYTITYT